MRSQGIIKPSVKFVGGALITLTNGCKDCANFIPGPYEWREGEVDAHYYRFGGLCRRDIPAERVLIDIGCISHRNLESAHEKAERITACQAFNIPYNG